jgi:hypothetical protein
MTHRQLLKWIGLTVIIIMGLYLHWQKNPLVEIFSSEPKTVYYYQRHLKDDELISENRMDYINPDYYIRQYVQENVTHMRQGYYVSDSSGEFHYID